jgi:3-phytase
MSLPRTARAGFANPPVQRLEPRRLFATILPAVETDPMPHSGDSADDPAIWVHPTDPSLSTIIGTDKRGGLAAYGLDGRQLSYRADGNMNNVDLRYNFPLGGAAVDLVVASNRSNDSLSVYRVDHATRELVPAAARVIPSGLTIYGVCMYRSPVNGKYYAFASDRDTGETEQWELFDNGAGLVDARVVRTFDVGGTHEGMVADDAYGRLYVAEEEVALWRYGAEPGDGDARVLIDVAGVSDVKLYSDVEGLCIYYGPNGTGYLIASSQGSNEFAVYDRATETYVARFKLGATPAGIDQVSGTDGIDVLSYGLGPAFPEGIFIAQDDTNAPSNQNFKVASWRAIADAEGFFVNATQDPRVPPVLDLPTSVVGRHVFYNNSAHDGGSDEANSADDSAIATDKRALLPGETPTFANYTSYSRGINGMMIDIASTPTGRVVSGDDFVLASPDGAGGWVVADLAPPVSLRRGAGTSGSDRLTLTLPDGAFRNTWLRVTMKANANTGLASPDVFSFGNLVGETGDPVSPLRVGVKDLWLTRRSQFSAAPVTSRYDFNRDGRVSAMDLATVRSALRRSLSMFFAPPIAPSTSAASKALVSIEDEESRLLD